MANPDNSDDDGESPKSVVGTVGGGSSSSGGAAGPGPSRSPVTASSAGSSSSASMMMGRPGSHAAAIIAHSGVGAPSTAIPTIPAPQTTPLPHISTFASSSSMTPLPSSSLSAQSLPPFDSPQAVTGFAPQPPPQPERHLRRAFTNPSNDSAAMSSMTGSRPTQKFEPLAEQHCLITRPIILHLRLGPSRHYLRRTSRLRRRHLARPTLRLYRPCRRRLLHLSRLTVSLQHHRRRRTRRLSHPASMRTATMPRRARRARPDAAASWRKRAAQDTKPRGCHD